MSAKFQKVRLAARHVRGVQREASSSHPPPLRNCRKPTPPTPTSLHETQRRHPLKPSRLPSLKPATRVSSNTSNISLPLPPSLALFFRRLEMAPAAAGSLNLPTSRRFSFTGKCHQRSSFRLFPAVLLCSSRPASSLTWHQPGRGRKPAVVVRSGGGRNVGGGGGGGGSSGGGGGGDGEEGGASERNRAEAFLALAEMGRSLESLPADLRAAVQEGRIPGVIVRRFAEMENSPVLKWLLQFGGFKERLLADDLFLAKVAMECGVGIFTKTAAEWERRRENFKKELDFVIADVVMAIIADFMLVWLPAPTVSLRPALTIGAGPISRFFHSCPDNAFQVALAGTSYSFLQRIGAIVCNGSKLFVVGTASSLVGTSIMNTLINARKAVDKDFAEEAEDVPILSTTVAYGLYMAVSSNLRYQILAGVIEQRILEPLLHQQKILLSAVCFAIRTGNTFLGSLMWVDYARWTGIQKIRE